jgi:hypothetical protein
MLAKVISFGQEYPNHLEPISGRLWAVGLSSAEKSLLPNGHCDYWMIAAPSFSPGWSVSIVLNDRYSNDPTYTVWFVKSGGPILAPPPAPSLNGKTPKQRPYIPKPRLKRSIKIDKQLALRVINAWHQCVKATRYFGDRAFHGGLDGTSYFFCTESHYFGETWGPHPGVPSALVELAVALSMIPQSSTSERQNAIDLVIQKCGMLEQCLQSN